MVRLTVVVVLVVACLLGACTGVQRGGSCLSPMASRTVLVQAHPAAAERKPLPHRARNGGNARSRRPSKTPRARRTLLLPSCVSCLPAAASDDPIPIESFPYETGGCPGNIPFPAVDIDPTTFPTIPSVNIPTNIPAPLKCPSGRPRCAVCRGL